MKARAIHFPPKKILVPLDLSETSVSAWTQVQSLAQLFGAKVDGLYVQEWLHSSMGLGMGEPYLTAHASQQALQRLRSRLGADIPVVSETGSVEDTILSWGRDLGYDLIVMGGHGRTGIERVLKGSVSEAIVRHCEVPVWVVRRAVSVVRRILVPVNFESYALETLGQAACVAQLFSARLTLLHVVDVPVYEGAGAVKAPKHLLEQALATLPVEVREACRPQKRLAFGDPAERIAEAAEDADLVALAARRKGFLGEWLLGTTAERVLRHCRTSVLTFPVESPKKVASKRREAASLRK